MLTLNIFTVFCECWWLPWLLPLLLSLLSLWLLRRHWQKKYSDLEDVAQKLRKTIAGLESDLEQCGKEKSKLKGDLALCEGRYRELENAMKIQNEKILKLEEFEAKSNHAEVPSLDDASSEIIESANINTNVTESLGISNLSPNLDEKPSIQEDKFVKINNDNLQIVEGIGPKMESVLKESGIGNLSVLASKSHGELKAVLDKYGDKYRIIDPSDWAAQATLASNRDFDALIAHQKADGSEAKAEKLFIKLGIIKSYKLDDLKAVEGIGPKIELLLNEAGINTWKELASSSVSHLQAILSNAGARYKLADPSSWPKQAEYAVSGDWDGLETYQDFLDGGKLPT